MFSKIKNHTSVKKYSYIGNGAELLTSKKVVVVSIIAESKYVLLSWNIGSGGFDIDFGLYIPGVTTHQQPSTKVLCFADTQILQYNI